MSKPARPAPLVVASTNQAKIAELIELLGDRFSIESRPTDLADTVEDGETLEANAAKKAREVAAHTGMWTLADDTGLFVGPLAGRPGVHTARYAGPGATDADNVAKLLDELAGVADRQAEFRTVIALALPDGVVHLAEGAVVGRIAERAVGGGGFGYDPVFVPDEGDGRTFAEMGSVDKGRISHRGRALRAMLELIDRLEPRP